MSFDRSITLSFKDRREIVAGYERMVLDHMWSGKRPYFINFMFRALPGNEAVQKTIMIQEVRRAHDILSRHMVRKPQSKNWRDVLPIFIGSLDRPVPKNKRKLTRVSVPNEGCHVNVMALISPPRNERLKTGFDWVRRSRLNVDLVTHFEDCEQFYLNQRLERIHVEPMTYGNMTDYALKAFKARRVGPDDLLVL